MEHTPKSLFKHEKVLGSTIAGKVALWFHEKVDLKTDDFPVEYSVLLEKWTNQSENLTF